jgi:WD40-like Beta Propeller Repeat
VTEAELRARLRSPNIGDDDAEQRAWAVVRSTYSPPTATRRRRRWRIIVQALACAVVIAAIAGVSASAPRQALARWLRQAIGYSAQPHTRPMLAGWPGGGQLLINAPDGPWIVHRDGSRRHLGPYTAAAWSPHSLYVVAWRGATLAALDPHGHPHWRLTSDGPITAARWSPDGYRIAYIAGRALNIVAGDGTDEHQLDRSVDPVVPAWEPHTGQAHRIAFTNASGDIELRAADTGAPLWRVTPTAPPQQLLWSPDGTRLAAIAAHRLSVYTSHGRLIASTTVPAGDVLRAAAFAGHDRLAVIVSQVNQTADSVVLINADRRGLRRAPRVLFTVPEQITGVAWSPDQHWLLASSPSADQWIFIHATPPTRLTAIGQIASQFRRDGARSLGTPQLVGWQR